VHPATQIPVGWAYAETVSTNTTESRIVALGMQWPTVDPFLFCVHHNDAYPEGNAELGPDPTLLVDRDLGSDFSGAGGWNMYHGQVVPGFPQHPHRGFETVTFVRRGLIDHSDSLGAAARFGRGDVQWVTAGAGIVHSEMFPLLDADNPNPVELFQIWLNLPTSEKMTDPHFTMLWDRDIPRLVEKDAEGRRIEVTVVAGELAGLTPPPPPPDSWASRPEAELAIWLLQLEPHAEWELPPTAHAETVRSLYVFEGSSLQVGDLTMGLDTGATVDSDRPSKVVAGDTAVECLVLQGRPIGEPVAQYGPFVMNTNAEIEDALTDYRSTEFGGWPWPVDDPVHGPTRGRFARYTDGRVEEIDETSDLGR
jgi:redox-sensitive bicupin YhaK (pirin superfamily)